MYKSRQNRRLKSKIRSLPLKPLLYKAFRKTIFYSKGEKEGEQRTGFYLNKGSRYIMELEDY